MLLCDEASAESQHPLDREPRRLCRWLLQECLDRGVQLHHPAKAVSISTDVRGELSSIRIEETETGTETDVPCTRVIITAGSWSPQVFRTLFSLSDVHLPISSLAGHSLVVKSPRWSAEMESAGCHAIFTTTSSGWSAEAFSRLGGEIYIAGVNSSSIPLPPLPGDAQVSPQSVEQLKEEAMALMGTPQDLEILGEGLCFRPVTPWGLPIVARIGDQHLGPGVATRPGADGGVFLAAGHGPWGISLSLGTGMVLAEMSQGRRLSADVSSLARLEA